MSCGIATRSGRDGGTQVGPDFPYPFRPATRPTQLPVEWIPALFSWR